MPGSYQVARPPGQAHHPLRPEPRSFFRRRRTVSSTLREFVDALWGEPVHETPVNESWKETVARIRGGGNQRVPKDVYFFFLEVLPPHFLWGSLFAFAEGQEPIKLFARVGKGYACRQLTWEETLTFCSLAGVSPPR